MRWRVIPRPGLLYGVRGNGFGLVPILKDDRTVLFLVRRTLSR
jgi:hypothetical protein